MEAGTKRTINVKELLSCFLFKQFTTRLLHSGDNRQMSKSYYRVSFLSNSQQQNGRGCGASNVKELLSCFLFKQFTTNVAVHQVHGLMSKSYYRVSFLSNSQLVFSRYNTPEQCQRATIVFPF